MLPQRPLVALLAAYFCLALLYNWASPLFENADEPYHFPLIHYLANHSLSLPVQDPAQIQQWKQQGSQPPLYHLISAVLIMPFDRGDYDQIYRVNPHARLGIVADSNINATLHPLDRAQEFKGGTALAARLIRLFSTFLGMIVILATYHLTRYTFPDLPPWVSILAAALVAFNPMFLFVTTSINNDNLSNAVIALILVQLAQLYRRDTLPQFRDFLLIGALLGMGLLTKLSMGPFMLLVGLYWLALALKHHALVYMVKWGFVTLAIALLFSAWWYLRNYDLYGDFTGLNVFVKIVGERDMSLSQLWAERDSFIRSFWGIFGLFGVDMARWVYPAFNVMAAISTLGLIFYFLKQEKIITNHRGIPKIHRQYVDFPLIVLPVWSILSFISILRWTSMTPASQGRLWFVAMSALAALSAVGFHEIGRRTDFRLTFIPVIFSLSIATVTPFIWLRPAYAVPDLSPLAENPQFLATYADPEFPDQTIGLVSGDFPAEIIAGNEAHITLEFCTMTDLDRDWSIYVHLVDEWDVIVAQADFIPGRGYLLTSQMQAEKCWSDRYPITVQAGILAEDSPLQVRVGLYDAQNNVRMAQSNGETGYVLQATHVRVGDALSKYVFADSVRLRGYSISNRAATPGEEITLTLEWEILQPLNATLFIQIIDPVTAHKIASLDQPFQPENTSYQLTIDPAAPPGVYTVLIGFYQQPEPGVFDHLPITYAGTEAGQQGLALTRLRVE